MSKQEVTTNVDEAVEQPDRLTRDEIRAILIGSTPKPETRLVTIFGIELELRQPTLASIMDARDVEDPKVRATDMFIKYAYVPGTDEHVFEDTDREMILRWPFGKDLLALQDAITGLTGLDIDAAKEDLSQNPLDE